jgi:hypothetical protein
MCRFEELDMLVATTGTSMGGDGAIAGLIFIGIVVATTRAALIGYRAVRTGVDWRGVRAAGVWLLVPYAMGLLLGGPDAVWLMLRVAIDGTDLGYVWATPPLLVAAGLVFGVLVRLRQGPRNAGRDVEPRA